MAWRRGVGGGRKKILPLWTVLSCPAKEVTNLTLAGAFLRFQGHFYSFVLEDIVFKKKILIMKKLGELVVGSSDRKHQLFSDLHLKAEAILSKSSAAPLFRFSSVEIFKTSSLSSLVPGRWSGRGRPSCDVCVCVHVPGCAHGDRLTFLTAHLSFIPKCHVRGAHRQTVVSWQTVPPVIRS